eukprot:gene12250-5835_t
MSFSEIYEDNLIDIVVYLPPEDSKNWFLCSKNQQKHEEFYWKMFFHNKQISLPKNCILTPKQFYYIIYTKKNKMEDFISYQEICDDICELNIDETKFENLKKVSYSQMIKKMFDGINDENDDFYMNFLFCHADCLKFKNILMMKLFQLMKNDKLSKEEIQSKIINILNKWLLFDSKTSIATINFFKESFIIEIKNEELVNKFLNLTTLKLKPKIIMKDPPKSKFPKNFSSVLDFEPIEFSRQLTMIDSEIFFLMERIDILFENSISTFVTKSIVIEFDIKKRKKLLKFFIECTFEFFKLNELNLTQSFVYSLRSSPVHRLKNTWLCIPQKMKNEFDKLVKIFSTESNFKLIRNHTIQLQSPIIPCLNISLLDLSFVEAGNENHYQMINWTKRKYNYQIIENLFKNQQEKHNFKIHEKFKEMLFKQFENLNEFDDKKLFELSLKAEPRNK